MSSLEAIILLTTSAEINNGKFYKFCNQFLSMRKNNLSFNVFINNNDHDETAVMSFMSKLTIFKSAFIHTLNIPSELDIYIKETNNYSGKIPRLGLTSGPNIMFLEAIKFCFDKFDTVLVLETDCLLKKNCFEVSKLYVQTLPDFLISGSRYLGSQSTDELFSVFNMHYNGVAFYNTGSQEFKSLVKKMEEFIVSEVIKSPHNTVSYDMAFTGCLLRTDNIVSARRQLNKFINTTLIINCSPDFDSFITEDEINEIYPRHVIFHTKRNY